MPLKIKIPHIYCEYTEIRIDVFVNNQFSYSFYHSNTNDPVELNNLKPGELVFIKVVPINEGSPYDPTHQSSSYRIPLDTSFNLSSIYVNSNRFKINNNTVNVNTTSSCNKINLHTLDLSKTFESGYYEVFDGDKLIAKHNLDSRLKFSIDNNINLNHLLIKVYIFTISNIDLRLDINLSFCRSKFEFMNHSYVGLKDKKLMLSFDSSNSPAKIEVKIFSDKSRTNEIFSTFSQYQSNLTLNNFTKKSGYISCDLYDDFGISDSIDYSYILIPS